jgi:hypothetical protein
LVRILSDYHSSTLDLEDESIYRDLTKPIGALNPERLKTYTDRYHCLEEENRHQQTNIPFPPFHYGTHYSSAGTVLFYLLRMEPFTSQAIALQDGHFDHSDRLFHSLVTNQNFHIHICINRYIISTILILCALLYFARH